MGPGVKNKNKLALCINFHVQDDQHQGMISIIASQELRSCLAKCLQNASLSKFTSIAIPALGCGGLKYPPDEVIAAIITEILRCSFLPSSEGDPQQPKSDAKDIHMMRSTLRRIMIFVQPEDNIVKEVKRNLYFERAWVVYNAVWQHALLEVLCITKS